jgi:hypothetical protein
MATVKFEEPFRASRISGRLRSPARIAHKSGKKEFTLFCLDLSPILFRAWKFRERFGS